jgi:hypothetical protein
MYSPSCLLFAAILLLAPCYVDGSLPHLSTHSSSSLSLYDLLQLLLNQTDYLAITPQNLLHHPCPTC